MDPANIDKSNESIQKFAIKINMQSEFFNVCKFARSPKIEEDIGKNPALMYFEHSKSLSNPTAILNRIHNRILPIQGYKLSEGQCRGLAASFKGNPKLINTVIFDNNGIKDEDFGRILQGMQSLDHVKSIVYKLNDF